MRLSVTKSKELSRGKEGGVEPSMQKEQQSPTIYNNVLQQIEKILDR